METQLQFSSNACLFRHEREAHGLHGHGDNPHLCFFEGCERAVPGNGFPRRWNLFDHMRRVHDYSSSEQQLTSPEISPSVGIGKITKKKDTTGRRRRIGGNRAESQIMRRTRSDQSQKTSTPTPDKQNQRLLDDAERDYFGCRTRLLDELNHITPQDVFMHDKVNASLQELITLGLNYRRVVAGLISPK